MSGIGGAAVVEVLAVARGGGTGSEAVEAAAAVELLQCKYCQYTVKRVQHST